MARVVKRSAAEATKTSASRARQGAPSPLPVGSRLSSANLSRPLRQGRNGSATTPTTAGSSMLAASVPALRRRRSGFCAHCEADNNLTQPKRVKKDLFSCCLEDTKSYGHLFGFARAMWWLASLGCPVECFAP